MNFNQFVSTHASMTSEFIAEDFRMDSISKCRAMPRHIPRKAPAFKQPAPEPLTRIFPWGEVTLSYEEREITRNGKITKKGELKTELARKEATA